MNAKNPILITAVGFVLGPKRQDADSAKAAVTKAQDKLDQARQLLASNQAARESYKQDYSTVVRLGKAVPGDDDVRSLVVQLERAANRTHVDFQGIEVGTDTATAAPT
ncbi:MAG: hypothetical protein QOI80_3891, partial [Solirubrobacteraceae bacterium]|nr:hypothetical protein [Solirubrobacteraceae bacterium]